MSGQRAELLKLVRQLQVELAWVSRIGMVVESEPSAPNSEDLIQPGHPLVPVDAGQPEARRATGESDEPTNPFSDVPPPAFEPDPVELKSSLPAEGVRPAKARVRSSPTQKPWERYLPEDPPGFEPHPSAQPQDGDETRLGAAQSLDEVRSILGDCTRCKLHRAGRKNIVFGVGHPRAALMFIGEGPGRQEDIAGEPFVGEAGQLLTRIIEGGMKIRRADVYIANIVKCRPPGNRDPEPDEVAACEPFLKAQIHQVGPRVIVALGKYAAQTLLRSSTPISRLRGRWHIYEGIDLMPTFHPAYLLRNPKEKRAVWEDIQAVMRRLSEGTEAPGG